MIRVSIITVSDRVSRGEETDRSGPALRAALTEDMYSFVSTTVVPDEIDLIQSALREMCAQADVVITTGGTGLSPRDVTPEATLPLLDRVVPGIPDALRADAHARVPTAVLSRGVCGTVGNTLVINLPGSVAAVKDAALLLLPILPHAVETLHGEGPHGGMGR